MWTKDFMKEFITRLEGLFLWKETVRTRTFANLTKWALYADGKSYETKRSCFAPRGELPTSRPKRTRTVQMTDGQWTPIRTHVTCLKTFRSIPQSCSIVENNLTTFKMQAKPKNFTGIQIL